MENQLVLFPILLLICLFNVSASTERVNAASNAAPYIVALYKNENQFLCAGTIISERVILTTAHCASDTDTIVAGIGNLNDMDEGQQRKVVASRIHDGYSKIDDNIEDLKYDIGLLLLDDPLEFNTNVTTVLLQKEESALLFKHATLYGWGGEDSPPGEDDFILPSQNLKTAELPLHLMVYCAKLKTVVNNLKVANTNLICAGPITLFSLFKRSPNVCERDSGGPLVQYNANEGKMNQIGIVVGGNLPCADKKPSIFIKVSRFYKWITTIEKEFLTL